MDDLEDKSCGDCAYLEYSSFYDEHYCRNKKSGVYLTRPTYDSCACDEFLSRKHNLRSNKFRVKIKIDLELEDEIEAETEESASAQFKQRLRYNFNFLKGCKEKVEKIREGDKQYPYWS